MTLANDKLSSAVALRSGQSQSFANLQKMAVAERREAEPTTERRNELGLAVRQATIELLAESGRQ